ncbi:hypothetical protein HS088_TW17G00658 [Tripterygium wilfordii]|uniref:Polymerase nucleotidyl transferase domain-containing protein n=3 Tax=Tripterygium wilfordii TaxID=458696 RepID=A0A7J7CGE5_TRIWF|nr:uncharacterized protein LOC119982063 isoform X2 [Tripterygium wilfordii]KAF5733122.1 hypothetical protein HS088_TW17G00658 [Tripterygium wilfordii]
MGEHEGWSQPQPSDGPLPNGLLPNEAASVIRVLDPERWLKAEERTAELIDCIKPNPPSEERRNAVVVYVRHLIMKCFPCQVFTFGSVPLKTYLPDGDIDLTAFSENQSLKDSWAHQVRDMLENEEKNENAEFRVKEVQYIQAEVKIIKCLVENIVVDISFDQLGGLCTLCFLEEVDNLISQNHLFKRSIILIKAWCYYESRILGAHHGLISTYALETLVLYIFHVFNNSFAGPLEVLYRFLEFFSKFDWDNFCVSLWGPVPIGSLPDVTAEPPIKDCEELLLRKPFLDACTAVYAVFPTGQENQGQPFVSKHFNVIDPLRINNNLGRSVSKGNFFRIRSAFAFGAKKLARVLDCSKEDPYHEVNQFFMNTWDRHGSGHRPDAPRNDLWRSRQSNADHLSETESLKNNSNRKKGDTSSNRESQDDGTRHAPSQSLINGNPYNARTSKQSTRNISSNQDVLAGKGQRSFRPDSLVSDIQGRHPFARTCSSPELTDTYSEPSSQGRCVTAPDGSKDQIASARSDHGRRKNVESDNFSSPGIRSPTDDPSSVRHISSHQSLDVAADSSSVLTSYNEDSGLGVMAEKFMNSLGTQQMHQEEQDLVNMMASSTAHHYSGQMHVPLNSASSHLPLSLPPSILASMGYAQRNFGGLVPPNIPLIEASWGTNVQFPQGLVPSPLTHYFPVGLASNPEDSTESGNETYGSVEMNLGEGNNDFWHEQESSSTGGFDLDNGNFEMHQSDEKQHSTSASYDFVPSSRVGYSGNSMRVQQKIIRETRGSMREDHLDNFQHPENRGNEVYFNDRTVSSRSFRNAHTSSTRSKTSSESSWEGSSVKMSKSMRVRRGCRPNANVLQSAVYGKGKSVSEHSSPHGEDENREWNAVNAQLTMSSEMAERNVGPQSVSSLHVPRQQISGFEQAQASESDSLIPIAPMLLGPGLRQRTMDNSGVLPFAFYPTGPPVPFVTMLPLYNFPSETGTSDASTSQFNGEEGLDNSDSRNNFDSSEGIDQPEGVSPSSSIRGAAFVEPSEQSDILNSDFASHWKNLQYGRFCQNSRSPTPSIYPSPVGVPPVYLQGCFPWDGPGRPLSSNMNLFTQLMNYGPRLVPVAPLQSVSNRPTGVYQRYGDEMPRYRSGTGTYLPNPKMSTRERHSSNARRGNYSYEISEHHGDREGSWNTNLKSRPAGRSHNRNKAEKPSSRPERLTSESRPDRSWASHRHETHSSYQSQTGPIRPNSQSGAANVTYGMYPLPAMNPGTVSSNGPTIPSVVMLYPYDHNAGYGSSAEQLEFGSFGPVGFSSVNEVSQLSEASRLGGTYEEHRFQGSSAERSSPDQPSSPLQR